ncbi:diguanylate cyclase [Pararobbsia alpina]|uniref:diguanylate cyclase n=1 Tax=Pararobbsia alpina TaxID=621374 RepID=A0A6S7BS16_9BURK|nr:diguanylate cyclase [Pararobbsia alpina]CAB3793245.1 Response regulator PleD [Pararobbsia alpina]
MDEPIDTRPKLLIVDDQPVNIRLLNELFHADYQILMATNGPQAIRLCVDYLPDLVLLDIMMPTMDGYEVLARLRADELTRKIPVIFVTAQSDEADEERGLDLGAVDFISKPIKPAIVRARVRSHLLLKTQSDMLRHIALMDGLTGIPNRRRFEESAPAEWRRCARDMTALSIAIIDVDFFKNYNDCYGHQMGDECLKQVAHTLASLVRRPYDLVARYGGEEFICLLPNTEEQGAVALSHRLLDGVRALGIDHIDSDVDRIVTVSVGVATAYPSRGGDLQWLIASADRQLYKAKLSGRAKVMTVSAAPGIETSR